MKKVIVILFVASFHLFALDDISIPYSFSPKDTIKASKFTANNSEIQTKFNKLNDSLELNFIRFSDLNSGDSLLTKIRVDTLRVDNIRSNPNVDSISGNVRFTGAPTVNGVLTASGGVSGNLTGNVTGNVTGSISGGTVAGSTGTFTSTVSVDSLYSTKGINSAKRITATDLQVSDSIIGAKGSFSGALSSATLNTGNGANELYAMNQNVRTTDTVTHAKILSDTIRVSKRLASDSTYTRVIKADSIQVGTTTPFSLYNGWYKDTTFACSVFVDNVFQGPAFTMKKIVIGKTVTLMTKDLSGNTYDPGIHFFRSGNNIDSVSTGYESTLYRVSDGANGYDLSALANKITFGTSTTTPFDFGITYIKK